MENSSRVFIRGLPPSMGKDDFVAHFSKVAPTTDAKLIAHRRIGYVGYHTPDAAKAAVKYFNRSFIRTAKISAELAKPVEERGAHGKEYLHATSHLKESRGSGNALQSVSSPAIEANPDAVTSFAKRKLETKGPGNVEPDGGLERQPHAESHFVGSDAGSPKRRWIQRFSGQDSASSVNEYNSLTKHNEAEEGAGASDATIPEPATDEPQQGISSASDADWLRSRTSRLLDLVDADELVDSAEKGQPEDYPEQDAEPIEKHTEELPVSPGRDAEVDDGRAAPQVYPDENSDPKRLFVRNLSYYTTESSLAKLFAESGTVDETHMPTDPKIGRSKGYAYVSFDGADAADRALQTLDGKAFEGRLLHVMKASARRDKGIDLDAISHLPLKKQKYIKRKMEASSAAFKWNSLYMNPDAVLASVADRLGVTKSEILDPTSSDAAVKQAHAEANIVQETKAYFTGRGVNFDSFKGKNYSDHVILVKNFPFGTSGEELKKLFETYGPVERILMPPSGTIAIVEMDRTGATKSAFKALAYRRFKNSVLFLEKAPQGILDGRQGGEGFQEESEEKSTPREESLDPTSPSGVTSTLFVKNLNFSTTSAGLTDFFKPLKGFLSARVKTYTSSKKPGEVLSTGFGFVEFSSKAEAEAAVAAVNGHSLDGHNLVIRSSHKALDAAEERKKEDLARKAASRRTKVIIKNLPFEATKKDVRALFSPYGKLRSVRVPKKFDRSTRGFGFADFVTVKEAESAMNVLQGTHLLGRRLNLEFAAEDLIDPEEEIERMQQKIGKQTESLSLQKLTSGPRKKFVVNQEEEIDKF